MSDAEKQGKSWLLEFPTCLIFLAVATISNPPGWLLAATAAVMGVKRFVAS
jgi:hypothetical protein